MIKRNIPKKLIPVENLTEDFTIGASGIDVTSPPTKHPTVYDMENLNVDLDSGISLRKPLLYNSVVDKFPTKSVTGFMFDDSKIELYTEETATLGYVKENPKDVRYAVVYENINDPTDQIPADTVFFRPYYGIHIGGFGDIPIYTDRGETVPSNAVSVDVNKVNIVNTNTSTIVFGYVFNLSNSVLKHYAKATDLKSGNILKYRPIKITKTEDGGYKAEVLQIEVPIMYTDSSTNTSRIYFNMLDDYTYSFRDNYHAGYTYCSGAIMYTPSDETLEDVSNFTIEELTESDKFKIVDSLTKEEIDKLYLIKAFISHTVTETPGYSVYCTWEKSYDNVTWNPVEEFIAAQPSSNIVYLDITDNTVSYETLDSSYKYTRNVPFVPFTVNSNQDIIGNRPDVLVLNKMDSATYRFSLRSVAVPTIGDKTILTHTVEKISGFTNFEDGLNYIAVDNNRDASFTIKLTYTIKGNALTEANTNIRAMIRTIYASDAGEDNTSAERAFGDTLKDTILDALCDPTQALTPSYDKATNVTTLTRTVTIPIHLAIGWIAQKMCLKIILFDASQQVSDLNTLCSDTFDAIVGFNSYGTLLNSEDVSYLVPKEAISNPSDKTVTITDAEDESLTAYVHSRVHDTDLGNIHVHSDYTDGQLHYHNLNSYMTLDIDILEVLNSKNSIPVDILNSLQHVFNTSPKQYAFNNIHYVFENKEISFKIIIQTTIEFDFGSMSNYTNKWIGTITKTNCTITVPITLSLNGFLNIVSNPTALSTALLVAVNNHTFSGTITGNLETHVRGTVVYSEVTLDPPLTYTEKDAIGSQCMIKILTDLANSIADSSEYAHINANVSFKYAPLIKNNKTYKVEDVVPSLVSSERVLKYNNGTWEWKTVYNTVHVSDTRSQEILSDNINPESYTVEGTKSLTVTFLGLAIPWTVKTYTPVYIDKFKYVIWHDISSTPEQSLLKVGDTINLKTVYEALVSSDSSLRHNILYEVIGTSRYPTLSEQFYVDRYSKELASFPYTALFTNVKQIDNYKTVDIYNSNKIYYNYRIWHYGKNLKNVIYFSNADSTTTPMDNSLTLSTDTDDYVTTLTPWKDYLVAMTKNKTFLITKYSDSYVFKQVNTFVGLPDADSETCKSILNGVIFKTGTKVLVLHPNMYSSDDTVLNITDISKPISHLLVDGTNNFAVATEYYYYLFIPREKDTLVFKYEYTRKIWSKFTYPVVLRTAKLIEVHDILVIDENNVVYDFDKTIDWFKKKHNVDYLEYGDYLTEELVATPIQFYLDTGQKSSNMQYTKQFTESKFIIATMEVKDTFPIQTTIYVDGVNLAASHKYMAGNLQLVTTDANTDGSFSKTNPETIGYLNTHIVSDTSDTFNVMRQMILRYMGKGKTIRHVLKGNSTFNFKIYVLYYRYRIPHNKQ